MRIKKLLPCLMILFFASMGNSIAFSSFSPAPSVIVPQQAQEDYGYNFAFRELKKTLEKVYGLSIQINSDDRTLQEIPANTILIGKDNKLIQELIKKNSLRVPDNLDEEGYLLKTILHQTKPLVCILGGGIRGDLYGTFYFIERIRLDKNFPVKMNIHRAPAFSLRIAGGDSFENAFRMRYNTVYVGRTVSKLGEISSFVGGIAPYVLLAEFDPELFPKDTERYLEIKHNQAELKGKTNVKTRPQIPQTNAANYPHYSAKPWTSERFL